MYAHVYSHAHARAYAHAYAHICEQALGLWKKHCDVVDAVAEFGDGMVPDAAMAACLSALACPAAATRKAAAAALLELDRHRPVHPDRMFHRVFYRMLRQTDTSS